MATVKWGNKISKPVKLTAGCRQGGILSPYLFTIYVDSVLNRLAISGYGCHVKGVCFNSIMYADDLIILAISMQHIRHLVDICIEEFKIINMDININKSAFMRIGDRHGADVNAILVNNFSLRSVQEMKYLEIVICSGRRFTFNFQNIKHK